MKISGNIADTLTIRPVFCSRFNFVSCNLGWVTQPFPVLSMKTRGHGKTTVAGDIGTEIITDLHTPYFLPAYTMRKPEATADTGFSVLALGFTVEVLGGIGLLNFYRIPIRFPKNDAERIRDLMIRLYDLEPAPEAADLYRLALQKKMLYEIFGILIQHAEAKKKDPFPAAGESGCLPAVEYLKEHYAEPFALGKLRDMCHVSQAHFFRLFKKLTGVSPFTYLKDRRIEEAQKLLLTTSMGVARIGEKVGWNDQFHFSRIFKARTGYSPQQFRDQYAIGQLKPGLKQ